MSRLLEQLESPLDPAGRPFVQGAFAEEIVVADAVALEGRLDLGQQDLDRLGCQLLGITVARARNLLGKLEYVLA